ncbi:DUF4254 domain-containing protein [Amycolatopsis sp. TRM77291]
MLAFQVCGGSGDPVLAAARELAVLTLARADTTCALDDPVADDRSIAAAARKQRRLDREIARQTARIDDYVTGTVHACRRGALHTETIGALIARLATTWQHWQQLASLPVQDERVRAASAALAELIDAYDDLIRDIHTGRRSLPRRQNPASDRRE